MSEATSPVRLVPSAALHMFTYPDRESRKAFIMLCGDLRIPLLLYAPEVRERFLNQALVFQRPGADEELTWIDDFTISVSFAIVKGSKDGALVERVSERLQAVTVPRLLSALDESVDPVLHARRVRIAGLVSAAPDDERLAPYIERAFDSTDIGLRHAALDAISRDPRAGYRDALMKHVSDPDPDIAERIAAVLKLLPQ